MALEWLRMGNDHELAAQLHAKAEAKATAKAAKRQGTAPSPEGLQRAADFIGRTPQSRDRARAHHRHAASADRAGQTWATKLFGRRIGGDR